MEARDVYKMHEECMEYEFNNFQNNLQSLKKVINKHHNWAQEDHAALNLDLLLHPRRDATAGGFPFWDSSQARILLKCDIDIGIHDQMSPKELWHNGDEYQSFSLKKFRDHLTQEQRRRKHNAYWLHKSTAAKK